METPGRTKDYYNKINNPNANINEKSLEISQNTTKKPIGESKVFNWMLFGQMSIEFAIIIALPLLIFIFLGDILDILGFKQSAIWAKTKKATSNVYNVLGILFAIFLSFYSIISKIRKIEKLIKNK